MKHMGLTHKSPIVDDLVDIESVKGGLRQMIGPELKLSDLKPGYLVQMDNGDWCSVTMCHYIIRSITESDAQLCFCLVQSDRDICPYASRADWYLKHVQKVYGYASFADDAVFKSEPIGYGRNLIWERKPALKKMTVSEVCEALGYDVEIVKDSDNA